MLPEHSDNERMIRSQIVARGVSDRRVLDAFRSVPREVFVPESQRYAAYDDTPLPLARGQTISQPFIVALMTELLRLQPGDRVLEIGAGSGYQTAILARLVSHVYSSELEAELATTIAAPLASLGIDNVTLRVGDGTTVFRDEAPFDAILCAAAPAAIPEQLTAQLGEGGRCIIPVGSIESQHLYLIQRVRGRLLEKQLDAVRFVPLR